MRNMFALVLFVLLIGVAPASAQVGLLGGGYRASSWEGWMYYLQGDQVHMLQADQIEFVRRSMDMGRNAQLRRVTDDLTQYGGYYGLNTARGFYPLAKCNKGQRIGRYAADVGIGVLIGAIAGGKRGAAYGAGIGGAVAVREDLQCWGVNNNKIQVVGLDPDDEDMMVVDPPSAPPQTTPDRPRNGWDDRLRDQVNAGGNSWFGSQSSCRKQGMFTLKNESGEAIKVFQDDRPFGILQPRQSKCGTPLLDGELVEYEAEMVVAVSDGYTAQAQIVRAKPEGRQGGVWVWR